MLPYENVPLAWAIHSRKSSSPLKVRDQWPKTEDVERNTLFLPFILPPFFVSYEQWLCLFVFLVEEQALSTQWPHSCMRTLCVCVCSCRPENMELAWLKNRDNHVKPSSSCFDSLTCVSTGPLVSDISVDCYESDNAEKLPLKRECWKWGVYNMYLCLWFRCPCSYIFAGLPR